MLIRRDNYDNRFLDISYNILNRGGIIAFPADEGYSIGCDIKNKRAIQKLQRLRYFLSSNVLSSFHLIFSDLKSISDYAVIDRYTYRTLNKYLPGPYTFILKGSKRSDIFSKNRIFLKNTVRIRIPYNKNCQKLVHGFGKPLIAITAISSNENIIKNSWRIHDLYQNMIDVVIEDSSFPNDLFYTVSLLNDKFELISEGNVSHTVSIKDNEKGQSINEDQNFSKQVLESKKNQELILKTKEFTDEFYNYLSKHPDLIYQISSRKFEELIADILKSMGFYIELTPQARDEGRDILATFKTPLGELLTIVECKRYKPEHKIGIDLVERFLYVVDRKDNASCGLIATTSFFTRGSIEIARKLPYRLQLKDFSAIKEWISSYGKWGHDDKSNLWLPN